MQGISRIALLAALAATHGGMAAAQTDDDSVLLGTITLSASTLPVSLSETGATVNVVTAEDLKKSGELSVASQLARIPGVSMSRNGGLGTSTALRLRGLSGPYLGVRIDGLDVADPSGTQCAYDFGSTTMGGISRIEVLRGSQSALFGSEAIGGVVEITSFRATEEGTAGEIALEAGSYGTYSGTASVGVKTERAELSFSVSRTVTDGFSAYSGGTEDDGFRSTNVTFYAAYDLTDDIRIGANGIWRKSFTEFDDQTADQLNTEDGLLKGGRVFAEFDTGAVRHELSFARTVTERDYTYPAGWYSATTFDGSRDQLAYNGSWTANDQISLTWGADRTKETFDGSSTSGIVTDIDTGEATTKSVFAELLYSPNDTVDLSLALRHDDHSTFGGYDTGRLALAWHATDDLIIRAVASTGFRAPSLYELYSTDFGNPALKPETSRSFELGAEYSFGNGATVQATLFDTEIDDKIQWSGGSYNQVPGTTRTKGVELSGQTQIAEGWNLFGNYTYTDAYTVSGAVESVAVRVPRHDLTLGVEAQVTDRLSGLFTVQHVADFYDNGIWPAPTSKMPDYTVANISLSYEVNDTTAAYLRVENLFDETYETVRNYAQPGRSVYVGVRTSF